MKEISLKDLKLKEKVKRKPQFLGMRKEDIFEIKEYMDRIY